MNPSFSIEIDTLCFFLDHRIITSSYFNMVRMAALIFSHLASVSEELHNQFILQEPELLAVQQCFQEHACIETRAKIKCLLIEIHL